LKYYLWIIAETHEPHVPLRALKVEVGGAKV